MQIATVSPATHTPGNFSRLCCAHLVAWKLLTIIIAHNENKQRVCHVRIRRVKRLLNRWVGSQSKKKQSLECQIRVSQQIITVGSRLVSYI